MFCDVFEVQWPLYSIISDGGQSSVQRCNICDVSFKSHVRTCQIITLLSIPFHFRFLSKFEIQSSLFWPFLDVRSDSCWEVWDLWINSKFIIAPLHGIYLNNNSRRQVQMFLALKGIELRFFHNWKISAYSGDPRNIADPVVLDQRYSQLWLKKLLVGF